MWFYEDVTREAFEQRKDFVEEIMADLGAKPSPCELPYEPKTTTLLGDVCEVNRSGRVPFIYGNEYFRVDEVLFRHKPFIVIERGSYDELMGNILEDADPFPYDLSDEEVREEVMHSLRISEESLPER